MSDAHSLIVGCGDLGIALAQRLLARGQQVSGLRRSGAALPASMQALRGDVTQAASLLDLAAINPDILVYCVSADGQSDAQYRAAYVDGLRNVLAASRSAPHLRHVFFVSSTRVYGQASDAILDETSPAIAADFGGERLLEAEHLLDDMACDTTVLRLSGIYGPGRTRILRLATQPAAWPSQNSWSNRIHRDDAAAFMTFLIEKALHINRVKTNASHINPTNKDPKKNCYIVTDNRPTSQYEVLLWLAKQMGIDTSQVAIPAIHGGKRLSNQKMCASGFKLAFSEYRDGYSDLLKRLGEPPFDGMSSP